MSEKSIFLSAEEFRKFQNKPPRERDMDAVNKIREYMDKPYSGDIRKESFEVYFTRAEKIFREAYEYIEKKNNATGNKPHEEGLLFSEALAIVIGEDEFEHFLQAKKERAVQVILANRFSPESEAFKAGVKECKWVIDAEDRVSKLRDE